MHRSTATWLTIAVLLVLVLMTTATEEGRRNLPQVALLLLALGAIAAAVYVVGKSRERALSLEARRRDLRFSAKDPFATLREPFDLMRRTAGKAGHVANVCWGSWHELQVRAFDYEYTRGENSVRRYSCVMVAIPGGCRRSRSSPRTGSAGSPITSA